MVRSRGQGCQVASGGHPGGYPPPPLPVRYVLIAVIGLEEYLRDMVTPFPRNDRLFDRNPDLLTIMTMFLT